MTSDSQTNNGANQGAATFVDTELMSALADDLRVRIFAFLCERPASLQEVAVALGASESQVRYHASQLRKGGWVEPEDGGARRGRRYRAVQASPIPAGVWDQLPIPIKQHLAVRLMRLLYGDAAEAMAEETFLRDPHHLSVTPMVVDERGREDVKTLLEATVGGLQRIQAESNERIAKLDGSGSDTVAMTVAAAGYEAARDPEEGITATHTVQL